MIQRVDLGRAQEKQTSEIAFAVDHMRDEGGLKWGDGSGYRNKVLAVDILEGKKLWIFVVN